MRQVRLTSQALKDLESFDSGTKEKIKEALRHLARNPLDGKPLKGRFQKEKIWSYRLWPYRVLYRRVGSEWLDVLSIEHRKDVYR
ncbi:MAG: type II toxin-antitoxin system RelE/ParE family toxin [Nitrospirae bacterium]|nr:MAG: type II toxin-antitoxin system RelE/ParE family toxin [Nitrospirota bacterium]